MAAAVRARPGTDTQAITVTQDHICRDCDRFNTERATPTDVNTHVDPFLTVIIWTGSDMLDITFTRDHTPCDCDLS